MRPTIRRLALLAAALGSLLAPASAPAVATEKQIEEAVSKGVTYLKGQQKEGGEMPGFGGDWALTSLAAVGVAAADVNKAGAEGKDARSWYEGLVGTPTWPGEGAVSTDFERATLAAYAAGIDPARVSKRQNLIARIASYYQPASPGYYGSTFNATVFGLLALANVKTTGGALRVPQVVLDQAVEAVKANQHTDGGWTWEKAAGNEVALKKASEPDMTGAAMAALCSAGVANSNETIVNARKYLESIFEGSSGAFKSAFGNNTSSTAWPVERAQSLRHRPAGDRIPGRGAEQKDADQLPHLPAGERRRVPVWDLGQHRRLLLEPGRDPGAGQRQLHRHAADPRRRRAAVERGHPVRDRRSGNHLAGADRQRRDLAAEGLLGDAGAESDVNDAGDRAGRRGHGNHPGELRDRLPAGQRRRRDHPDQRLPGGPGRTMESLD